MTDSAPDTAPLTNPADPPALAARPLDERLRALCRWLLDSGDITTEGVRWVEKVLNEDEAA